jgi:hypothetical protein
MDPRDQTVLYHRVHGSFPFTSRDSPVQAAHITCSRWPLLHCPTPAATSPIRAKRRVKSTTIQPKSNAYQSRSHGSAPSTSIPPIRRNTPQPISPLRSRSDVRNGFSQQRTIPRKIEPPLFLGMGSPARTTRPGPARNFRAWAGFL